MHEVSLAYCDILYSSLSISIHYLSELRYRRFQQRVQINMETWDSLVYILSLVGHVRYKAYLFKVMQSIKFA